MKRLSVQDRNLLLTGDPYFQFDPIVYDCCFWLPKVAIPPIIQNQLHYLIPEEIVNSDSDEFIPSDNENADNHSSDSELWETPSPHSDTNDLSSNASQTEHSPHVNNSN